MVNNAHDIFRLNVGFIIHQTIGYSRDFPVEIPKLRFPDLEIDDIKGGARVTRTAQGLLVQVKLSACTQVECVRCLTECMQSLEVEFTELYAFTRDSVTESGLIVSENGKIDLEPLVRDEMLLAIPISSLCRQDCLGLCPTCGENLNEGPCNHSEEPGNPRLSVLKLLLDLKNQESSGE